MTSNQRELWSLYASGHTVSEIARITGRAKSTISTTLKRIKNPAAKEHKSKPCPHSNSCFACPLRDCAVNGSVALHANMLPYDMEVHA